MPITLSWVARHSAFLLTRFRIGEDGKSAYQRALGREWRRPTVVFGEQILFKPVGAEGQKRASPLEAGVALGRYIGTASRNADLLVMTPTGVEKGHSLHRRAEIDRWSTEGFGALRSRIAVEDVQSGRASSTKSSGYARSSWRTAKG